MPQSYTPEFKKKLEAYRFVEKYQKDFGLRWLLRRLNICPNAYYNYRKHRKADYYTQKSRVQAQIRKIYHENNGVDGYRSMTVYLTRKGFHYSPITIHKYMNKETGLYAIVRPKKPEYIHGNSHKVFENRLAGNFTAERANQKWCTDFTYLFLKNGEIRYNCSILDLYDRSIIMCVLIVSMGIELHIKLELHKSIYFSHQCYKKA